ncbi:unnamed protein product [Symbiodinium sp. KB8]|nr:unnamed protein product [Symbiodinium sp. KB8]
MPLVMQLTESQAYTLAAHVWLKHSVEQDVPMARRRQSWSTSQRSGGPWCAEQSQRILRVTAGAGRGGQGELAEYHPRFAENSELAARSALFLVLCGLPFLIPEGEIQSLDAFLHTGFYAVGVVSFIVLHLKRNLGATMAATASGLRGVLLAVCNAWFLFGICPDGYTDDVCGRTEAFKICNFAEAVGTCVVLGSIFALLVYIVPYPLTALNSAKEVATEMTHEVPKILRLFVEFLETDKSNDYGQDRIQRHIRRLHKESGRLADSVKHAWWECFGCGRRQLDRWALGVLEQSLQKTYDAPLRAGIMRWTACAAHTWIQGIWAVAELTKTEARSEKHVALIKVVKAHFLPIVDMVEELLVSVVSVDSLVHFTSADAERVRVLKDKIHEAKGRFREAFWEERARIMAEQTDERSMRNSINELRVIHVVAFNMMMILRDFLEYAEQILRHHDGEADLQKVVEHDWLGGLFQGIATFQNVRHVLRVVLSVMLGFFLGYCGGGFVTPGTAAIAKATATLLSKNQGSALVKNLNRIQGVVLGTIFGQLIDTIFHRSITCRYADVNDLLLGACFALFMYVTMFIRFHVSEFAIMGVQMANFGGQEMLVGSCGEERNMEAFDLGFQRGVGGVMDLWRSRANRGESVFQTARSVAFSRKPESLEALDSVTVNLLAIVFLVSVDLLFARERASVPRLRLSHGFMWLTTFQCILSRCKLWTWLPRTWAAIWRAQSYHRMAHQSWMAIKQNVLAALDVEQPEVHFTRQEMLNMLAETESLGDEASSEPRYWRTEWRAPMFSSTIKEIHDVRYALSNLEYSMSVHGQNGAPKAKYVQEILKTGSMPKFKQLLSEKFDVVSELLEVFTHETCTRWSALDDKAAYTDFREEQWRIQSAVLTEMGDA